MSSSIGTNICDLRWPWTA